MAKIKESLLEIERQCQEIRAMASDPEVDIDCLADSIESMEAIKEVKINSYGFVNMDMNMEIESQKARIDYLNNVVKGMKEHLKALENNQQRFKDRLMGMMIATGLDEEGLHTEMFDIKVVQKGGIQELSLEEDKIPQSFMKVTYSPDTEKIREYLKTNTCEWARLLPKGKRLVIK